MSPREGTPRLVHLGIGAFARAHTLTYTAQASGWDVAVFTGRGPEVARQLTAQDGVYGVVVRGPEGDEVQRVDVIDQAYPADDEQALAALVADPQTCVVTLTITEKGYGTGAEDSTPARLARALRARREAGVAEPIALVSCDNLVGNGQVLRAALEAECDPATRDWLADHVDVISTMVDRITPVAGDAERRISGEALGLPGGVDQAAVVTEPFSEWVIEDRFRGRRPAWEHAGAQLVADVAIHEKRKLRLLNGAHSLLAYAGQNAGHATVPEAIADPALRAQVEALWAEARETIDLPEAELTAYTEALLERFANRRLADALVRIAADGTEKLAVRTLPVIAERGGPEHSPGEVAAVRAWCGWVTDRVRDGQEVADPRAEQIAQAVTESDDRARVLALVSLIGGGELSGLDPGQLTDAVLAGA